MTCDVSLNGIYDFDSWHHFDKKKNILGTYESWMFDNTKAVDVQPNWQKHKQR